MPSYADIRKPAGTARMWQNLIMSNQHRLPWKIASVVGRIFSERELVFMFAICRRQSVCLSSVVCLSVTFVHPTQAIEIFGNVSTPFGTLAICDSS